MNEHGYLKCLYLIIDKRDIKREICQNKFDTADGQTLANYHLAKKYTSAERKRINRIEHGYKQFLSQIVSGCT